MSVDPQASPRGSISLDPAQLSQMQQQMQQLYAQVQQQAQQLQHAAAVAQQSIAGAPVSRVSDLPKIRAPTSFNGAMGFAVDSWISELKQQFVYYGAQFTNDEAKIRFAVAYLSDAALRWWEQQPTCNTWIDFVARLHGRFRPVHAAMLARQRLGKLRQRPGQSVNQYVSIFQNTLTPITDMGDMDQVTQFLNGLLGSIAAKVWEKHPENLVQAIDAAVSIEAMGNFGRASMPFTPRYNGSNGSSSSTSGADSDLMDLNYFGEEFAEEKPTDSGEVQAMRHAMSVMQAQLNEQMQLNALRASAPQSRFGAYPSRAKGDRIDGLSPELIKSLQATGKCFRCKKVGHMKNECPDRQKNA